MRIKVTFKTSKLPIIYRHRFMSLIKEALSRSDPEYKDSLYPDKDSEYSKIAKPFSFSISMPSGRFAKKELIFIDNTSSIEDTVFYFPKDNTITFYVSSSDYQFIMNLYNGLLEIKEFDFMKDIKLKFDKVFMLNERKINSNSIIFKTHSPISIENKSGSPLLPEETNLDEFNKHFNEIHSRIIKDIRGGSLYQPLGFTPLQIRKQVVKHTLRGFREKTGKPYMMLTCFEGYFKLKGDPRDLQMLYQIGIGLRTGQGFGMVEVV